MKFPCGLSMALHSWRVGMKWSLKIRERHSSREPTPTFGSPSRPGKHTADCFPLKGEPILLIVHPVLKEYFLKLDIASQPPDYDFGLPVEDLLSSAVHPPVLTLVLEHNQGYPQNIEVQASDMGSGVGVTVEDVLKTVGADLRLSSSHREWSGLNDDTRREVETAFEDRARTEDERSRGLRRIDYLSGKSRLQIFPKHPLFEDREIT
ncbi:hypothetical protein BJY52DRAFT_1268641 [Lactarius psammicola]|nr:hypothetical protein BJY52DRAFT_1268641 [Lactarius psammicola]